MIEMKIKGVTVDPVTSMPIIILKDKEGKRTLPIWVGVFEAGAIALELEGMIAPRPLTHDLIKSIIEGLQGRVTQVHVYSLRDNTFFAKIVICRGKKKVNIDARPSDALALALRTGVPIYVSEEALDDISKFDRFEEGEEIEKLKLFLANLKPEDFGKYKM
ncbi:MAG: bifunctional nuclease family protein [Nitrospirae bacterium]|nr:bifunctional nuclease family protein [Nitrospirota bacterium]